MAHTALEQVHCQPTHQPTTASSHNVFFDHIQFYAGYRKLIFPLEKIIGTSLRKPSVYILHPATTVRNFRFSAPMKHYQEFHRAPLYDALILLTSVAHVSAFDFINSGERVYSIALACREDLCLQFLME